MKLIPVMNVLVWGVIAAFVIFLVAAYHAPGGAPFMIPGQYDEPTNPVTHVQAPWRIDYLQSLR